MGLGSIDPRRFAREQASVNGSLAADTLVRLAELLCGARAPNQQHNMLRYRVTGFVTAKDQPALRIELNGELALRCQRCLEPMAFRLALGREIVLAAGADEFEPAADEQESVDIIPIVNRLDLRELVEEEILLALPLAPRHPADACEASAAGREPEGPADASPFAALARLKH